MRSRYQRAANGMLGAVLVAALTAGTAAAQAPPGGQQVAKKYTNKHEFKLPITIDDAARASLREVQLWVKRPGAPWQVQDRVPPTQSGFTFHAIQDDEYAFNVVTVDKLGNSVPADVSREAPAVVVVVDTHPPEFTVSSFDEPGETCLRCIVQDANPDYQNVKMSWQSPDQSWQPLEAFPGQVGVFRITNPNMINASVRVTVRDMAQNQTVRDISVKDVMTGGTPQRPTPAVTPPPANVAAVPNALPTLNSVGSAVNPPAPTGNSNLVQTRYQAPAATPTEPVKPAAPPPNPSAYADVPPQKTLTPSASAMTAQNGVPRQIINTLHASVDYRIDQVGPSGIGKVEIWMTGDSGNNWKRLCEYHNRKSPAEIDLPGEGLFGLRLVVTNGNGFGGHTPARGDNPTNWIEVDVTPPFAQLKEIEPVTNGSTIDLRWTVSDKNLALEPIHLYYAVRKEGPWIPIVRNLKNDGRHAWAFPRDQGGQFFIRLEAFDLAGNFTRCETNTPLQLDMTEPQAQVVGISGLTSPGTTQQGN